LLYNQNTELLSFVAIKVANWKFAVPLRKVREDTVQGPILREPHTTVCVE